MGINRSEKAKCVERNVYRKMKYRGKILVYLTEDTPITKLK